MRNLAALIEECWIAETGQVDNSYIKAHCFASSATARCVPIPLASRLSVGQRRSTPWSMCVGVSPPSSLLLAIRRIGKRADLLIAGIVRMKRVNANRGYDTNGINAPWTRRERSRRPPGRRKRHRPLQYCERRNKHRRRVEALFFHLKDSRSVATNKDSVGRTFLSALALAAETPFWLCTSSDPRISAS